MQIKNILILSTALLTSSLALANTLDSDDVPNRCWQVCGPVVGISHKCDAIHDNDSAERKCVCEWQQASTLVPLCEACISQYRNETKHDDDDDDDGDDRDDDDDKDNDRDNDRDDDKDNDRDNDRDDDNDNDRDSRTKRSNKRSTRKSKRDHPHDNDANDILRACSFTTTSYNPTAATSAISAASTLIPSTSATATGSSSSSSSASGSRSGSGSASSADNDTNAASGQGVPRAVSLAAAAGLIGLAWL